MSYYRPSFSQTVAMSRGNGRGGYSSSRGSSSYRGNSRGGSSWSDRGSRGNFSSSRGGGGGSSGRFSSSWNNSSSNHSFDSRPRYSSSGGGERYSSASRGRPEDSSYRRSSYRSEGPNTSYSSSRDGGTRSPERKRMRTEAPSSRRSHEGGYGGDSYGGSNASRYESSANNYSERRFNEERRPAFRSPREEFRKPGGPARSPRGGGGGYRGRVSSRGIRGTRGSRIARDTLLRRRVLDSRSYVRKRGATLRSTTDYLRALRISKIRSAAVRRSVKKSKSVEKEESDKEENWDEDVNENEEKKSEIKSEKEDGDEKKSVVKKSPKKEKDEKEAQESEKEEKKESTDEDRPRSKYTGRPFIRLTCIHCKMKCVTFKEYSSHFFSGRHITAMRKIALKQKAVLAKMRATQRLAQRELEKNEESLGTRTIFCPLCKLNYRQKKEVHQMSEAHRNMKKFLMPYCRTCYITFKSPMLYENHMCSLDHIRRKARSETVNGTKNESDKEVESPVEDDLENFMTLDSVGDVDEEDEEGNKISKSPGDEKESMKSKEPVNVGVEHCKKVSVYYCDLCQFYLSRHLEDEVALNAHCGTRKHLQQYVRYKKDKELQRKAEKIHRKSQEAKEAKEAAKEKDKVKDKVKSEDTEETGPEKKEEKPVTEGGKDEVVDEKMWADVDKDLGEILASVNKETGNKSSDEDDDSRPNGERYDRFKLSEKGVDEKGDKIVKKESVEQEEKEIVEKVQPEEIKLEEDGEQNEDK